MDPFSELMKHCTLCPRKCGIDRTEGNMGFCGLPDRLAIDCALPHLGEEPPLSGCHGSGTIFFSSCNLRCIFCQNYQISHGITDSAMTSDELAQVMLDLQEEKCHNINLVTPTPQIPMIMESFHLARAKGLHIPLVYNCSGYEDPDIIRHLQGDVDIYLPDFKYGLDDVAYRYSGVKDYVTYAASALEEMARQVDEGLEMNDGLAIRGLLIRHLVMPGMVKNSLSALSIIRSRLSRDVNLSIMSQYTPIASVKNDPLLYRRVTVDEYEAVIDGALALGFENIFIQDVDDRNLIPDFEREKPFTWEEKDEER